MIPLLEPRSYRTTLLQYAIPKSFTEHPPASTLAHPLRDAASIASGVVPGESGKVEIYFDERGWCNYA